MCLIPRTCLDIKVHAKCNARAIPVNTTKPIKHVLLCMHVNSDATCVVWSSMSEHRETKELFLKKEVKLSSMFSFNVKDSVNLCIYDKCIANYKLFLYNYNANLTLVTT